jgi:hypothetical protein
MIRQKYGILSLWSFALLAACGPPERAQSKTSAGEAARPPDSLATSTRSGVEIWFTLSRPGRSKEGESCVERGLEIRGQGRRLPVPLLYTGEAPTVINDSTMRAMLWTNCRPVTAYRVDLRTGRPVREAEGRRKP